MIKHTKYFFSVILILAICASFFACSAPVNFQCDFCGRNITEGNKNKITYSYDSNDYFACDNCAEEMSEIKESVFDETRYEAETAEEDWVMEEAVFVQSSLIPENAKLLAYGYDENDNLYELVGEQINMYAGTVNKFGVIKNDEWLIPMTEDTPFHDKDGQYIDGGIPLIGGRSVNDLSLKADYSSGFSTELRYIGNGCFYMYAYRHNSYSVIWNVETNESFNVSQGSDWDYYNYVLEIDLPEERYVINNDGRFLLRHEEKCFLLDTDTMDLQELPFLKDREDTLGGVVIGPYSEGKIALIKQRGVADPSNGFYDISGNKVIDLSNYLITDYAVAFIDGQATFTTQDYDGTYYLTTIDSNGNEISKTEK